MLRPRVAAAEEEVVGAALNRRELLRLSTAVGVGAVMPTYGAFAGMKGARGNLFVLPPLRFKNQL